MLNSGKSIRPNFFLFYFPQMGFCFFGVVPKSRIMRQLLFFFNQSEFPLDVKDTSPGLSFYPLTPVIVPVS
jgi:hypothetical protein